MELYTELFHAIIPDLLSLLLVTILKLFSLVFIISTYSLYAWREIERDTNLMFKTW